MVALQALTLYSEKTAGNTLDLRVKLTSEIDANWKPPEIHFTPENALLRREFNVRNDRVMTYILKLRCIHRVRKLLLLKTKA